VRTWVALLRGVNVGGHTKVAMPALREGLAAAGFADVRTYVNSGNVVARSAHDDPGQVAAAVGAVASELAGREVAVVVRTGAQLAEVLAWDPFPEAAAERPNLVHVHHLVAEPDPERLRALLTADVAPARVAARGLDLVIDHAERSTGGPLDKALRRLGTEGTARNWRTLRTLVDLAGPTPG